MWWNKNTIHTYFCISHREKVDLPAFRVRPSHVSGSYAEVRERFLSNGSEELTEILVSQLKNAMLAQAVGLEKPGDWNWWIFMGKKWKINLRFHILDHVFYVSLFLDVD